MPIIDWDNMKAKWDEYTELSAKGDKLWDQTQEVFHLLGKLKISDFDSFEDYKMRRDYYYRQIDAFAKERQETHVKAMAALKASGVGQNTQYA